MAYWMILTISPLLLGASLSLTSYGFVSAVMEQGERAFGLTRLLPFLFAIGGFTLLYAVVPARPVAFRHALAGGVVAGVLFELLKARSEEHTSELQSLMRISYA